MKDKIPLSVDTRNARVFVMEERNKNVYGSVTNSVGKLQFVKQSRHERAYVTRAF